MTHPRARFLETQIVKALQYSPCVGVMGMRQVGKSTLLKKLAVRYYTFDLDEFAAQFEREKRTLLEAPGLPLALDEIQKHPTAFDALKYSIDNKKQPGRFLISGSVRFSSRRQIRESLTGRLVSFELLPLTVAESHHQGVSHFLHQVSRANAGTLPKQLKNRAWVTESQLLHFLDTGGLPGICFRRDESTRHKLLESHLDALLGRDIHLLRQIRLDPQKLLLLVTELAQLQGLPVNVSHLARVVGCSVPTANVILKALEGLFLIRAHGTTYFLEDCGLSQFLQPRGQTLTRLDMMRCLFHELRAQLAYQSCPPAQLTAYHTRGGIDIPFLVKYKAGQTVALVVDEAEYPSDKSMKSLTWFKKSQPNALLLILCRCQEAFQTASGVACVPWTWVF